MALYKRINNNFYGSYQDFQASIGLSLRHLIILYNSGTMKTGSAITKINNQSYKFNAVVCKDPCRNGK